MLKINLIFSNNHTVQICILADACGILTDEFVSDLCSLTWSRLSGRTVWKPFQVFTKRFSIRIGEIDASPSMSHSSQKDLQKVSSYPWGCIYSLHGQSLLAMHGILQCCKVLISICIFQEAFGGCLLYFAQTTMRTFNFRAIISAATSEYRDLTERISKFNTRIVLLKLVNES